MESQSPDFGINRRELTLILAECGYSIKSFFRNNGISSATFYRNCPGDLSEVPRDIVQQLYDYVLDANYREALAVTRGAERTKYLAGYEMRGVLEYCSRSQVAFAEHLGKSTKTVREILLCYPTVPLQYIDSMQFFIGDPDLFDEALAHVRRKEKERQSARKKPVVHEEAQGQEEGA